MSLGHRHSSLFVLMSHPCLSFVAANTLNNANSVRERSCRSSLFKQPCENSFWNTILEGHCAKATSRNVNVCEVTCCVAWHTVKFLSLHPFWAPPQVMPKFLSLLHCLWNLSTHFLTELYKQTVCRELSRNTILSDVHIINGQGIASLTWRQLPHLPFWNISVAVLASWEKNVAQQFCVRAVQMPAASVVSDKPLVSQTTRSSLKVVCL